MSPTAQLASKQLEEIIKDERCETKVEGGFTSQWRMVRRSSIQQISAQY
jgi:hypothetical protein